MRLLAFFKTNGMDGGEARGTVCPAVGRLRRRRRYAARRAVAGNDQGRFMDQEPEDPHGRRTISVPASVIEELRAHWKLQQEQRLALGFGRVSVELIFAMADGSPYGPNTLPRDWPARHGGRRAANQPAQPAAPLRLKSHCGRDRHLDHQPPLGACQPLDHPLGVYGHLYRIPMIVRRRWSRRCLPASGRSSGGNPVAKPLFVPMSFRRPHR
jgi:hypothetical protein